VDVVGSYAALAERWGRPLPADFDPHKPHIDQYTWPCECGGIKHRAAEVIDTWFDSGAMPYAQWHYPFEHEEEFRAHFPADYICEGVDQTRGWFYSLLAIATTAFDSMAYRHVIVNELVLDADGQKMSKSRGNVVNPWEMIEEFGADTVRLYLLASSQVWLPKRFDRATIKDAAGKFINALKNSYAFFAGYAGDWSPETAPPVDQRPLVDRWLLSRLDATVEAVHQAWGGYDPTAGVRALMEFMVDDVSQWYVRANRARFWAVDSVAEPAAVATLHEALLTVARLLAPAAPFVSDWLHRALAGTSVHLARFPEAGRRRQPDLEQGMQAVRRLASLAHGAQQEHRLPVRQPLGRMQVAVPGVVRGAVFDQLLELLRAEVNVKSVETVSSDAELVRLKARPNFRSLGKRYGKRTPQVAAAAARLAADQLRGLEQGREAALELDGELVTYQSEDVVVEREVASDWIVAADGPFVVALDPRLDQALRHEGTAREVVNRIQRLRKEAGYVYTDRIGVWMEGSEPVLAAVRDYADFIQGETLARHLELGARAPAPDLEQQVDVDGHTVVVGVQRDSDVRAGKGPQPTDRA
jgi:isoleucyl-tRNA synthetase